MITRCRSKKLHNYASYGGKGITVCKRWEKFENFLADMGEVSEGKSLDRKNNNLGYTPENCRWATVTEQNRNRYTTRRLTLNGVTLTACEWSERLGMKYHTLMARLNDYGWSVEKALTTKVL
jgi:hypothetical protein